MERNIKNNLSKHQILSKIAICFALLLVVFLVPKCCNKAFATEENKEFCYLSDIPYDPASKSGWKELRLDKAGDDSLISVKIEGAYYSFEKGIWAHAASTVIYDLRNYDYDYFTAYIGLNKTAASSSNGVIFKIYTSTDGKNWNLRENEAGKVCKPGDNATFVKIDIKTEKFLKLEAGSNGNNGNDHSVYADAKLIKDTYVDEADRLVPSITELDNRIKTEFANADFTNPEYELLVLKRELISKAGNYALKKFLGESEINKNTYEWLTGDVNNLRLYILGGTPEGGSYYNSLTQLARLYDEYKDDFIDTEVLNNKWYPQMTYGDLYKKMAISLSLTHSQRVGLWMQSGATENQSDALRRYAIYKYMHKNGKLKATESLDITPWFEALQVEEMRFIMNNAIDDEEILWLNTYVQDRLDQYKTTNYLTPHPYIAYVWPNYGNAIYYDEANKEYFNELFSVKDRENSEENKKIGLFDLSYTIPGGKNTKSYEISVTRGTAEYKLYKVWMNMRNKFGTGCVCGGISKTGSNIRATHGIPATVIGQPGHAALLYYTKDAQGRGYWNIDNDVSGWTASEKGERMLLGWGNASYSRGSYQVVYMALAQEALNDYENLEKAQKNIILANVYKGDLEKQEEIYRKALEIQPINIDAWYGLIEVYNQNENKTENDFYDLAQELAENLKCFPLPMYQLTNLIKPKLTSVENSYKFTLLQTRILTEASKLPNNTADKYYVYQPSLTRLEANFLLGKLDKTIATFSFDGEDAGKIVLSSRFDGNGVRWDYSIDGKQTWKEVSFTAEEPHKLQLTQEQINNITAENDIYIHIVGVNYDEENLYKIDITNGTIPNNLYANDLENRIVGANLTMEWRMKETDAWTSYKDASPDLTGDKTVQVRVGATKTALPSEIATYNYTQDNQPDTRKYIPVSHLTIAGVSTEATANQGQAANAIDGNYNTRYHSAWNGTDTQRFIIIKLDKPVYLSAVEFVPAGGGNGKIYDGTIYGSTDGENWEVLSQKTGLTYTNKADTVEQAIANTKSFDIEGDKQVQYVKIVADRTNGNWFAAREFNLYQDITKNPHPTAGIGYDTTEPTNKDVVARLINPSTNIRITNNNGSDTYVFTENGEFTFEFIDDETGLTGTAKAKVNWIDKIAPTATIEYSITTETSNEVIATLIPSEKVTVLNNGEEATDENESDTVLNPYTYTFSKNGEFTFRFKDIAGNIGTATAKVDWIIEEGIENPDQPIKPEEPTEPDKPDKPEQPDKPVSPDKITSNKYKIEDKYISRISPATTVSIFKENVETEQEIVITDETGNILKENDLIGTNAKIKVGSLEYTLIVTGDTNNDGKVDLQDILQMNKHRLNKTSLKGIGLIAGDVNQDGKVDLQDILQINKYRLGKIDNL